jgi:hypothetical protein
LDRNALMNGFEGRQRVQGPIPHYDPNNVPRPRPPANADVIELERPIQHLIQSLDRSVRVTVNSRNQITQIAIRAEQRAEYEFRLRFPNANIQYVPLFMNNNEEEKYHDEEEGD